MIQDGSFTKKGPFGQANPFDRRTRMDRLRQDDGDTLPSVMAQLDKEFGSRKDWSAVRGIVRNGLLSELRDTSNPLIGFSGLEKPEPGEPPAKFEARLFNQLRLPRSIRALDKARASIRSGNIQGYATSHQQLVQNRSAILEQSRQKKQADAVESLPFTLDAWVEANATETRVKLKQGLTGEISVKDATEVMLHRGLDPSAIAAEFSKVLPPDFRQQVEERRMLEMVRPKPLADVMQEKHGLFAQAFQKLTPEDQAGVVKHMEKQEPGFSEKFADVLYSGDFETINKLQGGANIPGLLAASVLSAPQQLEKTSAWLTKRDKSVMAGDAIPLSQDLKDRLGASLNTVMAGLDMFGGAATIANKGPEVLARIARSLGKDEWARAFAKMMPMKDAAKVGESTATLISRLSDQEILDIAKGVVKEPDDVAQKATTDAKSAQDTQKAVQEPTPVETPQATQEPAMAQSEAIAEPLPGDTAPVLDSGTPNAPESGGSIASVLRGAAGKLGERADAIKAELDAMAEQGFRDTIGAGVGGVDPRRIQYITKAAEYGAVRLAQGVTDKAAWTAEMVVRAGEQIKPHLEAIWDALHKEDPDAAMGAYFEQTGYGRAYEAFKGAPLDDAKTPTGISNKIQKSEAEVQGIIDSIPSTQGHTVEELAQMGRRLIDAPGGRFDPDLIAQSVGRGEMELTAENVGVLIEGKRRKINAIDAVVAELSKRPGDKVLLEDLELKRANLQDYLNDIQQGKGRWSDTGRALQVAVDVDTGNWEEVLAEMKRGGRATPTEMKEAEAASGAKKAASRDFDEMREAIASPYSPNTSGTKDTVANTLRRRLSAVNKGIQAERGARRSGLIKEKNAIEDALREMGLVQTGEKALLKAAQRAFNRVRKIDDEAVRKEYRQFWVNEIKAKSKTAKEYSDWWNKQIAKSDKDFHANIEKKKLEESAAYKTFWKGQLDDQAKSEKQYSDWWNEQLKERQAQWQKGKNMGDAAVNREYQDWWKLQLREKAKAEKEYSDFWNKALKENQKEFENATGKKASEAKKEYADWWNEQKKSNVFLEDDQTFYNQLARLSDLKNQAMGLADIPEPKAKSVLSTELANIKAEADMWAGRVKHKINASKVPIYEKRIRNATGVFRGFLLGADIGVLTRQGLFGLSQIPSFIKSVAKAGKNTFSEVERAKWQTAMDEAQLPDGRRLQPIRKKAGLALTDTFNKQEEILASRVFSKIPVVGGSLERFQSTFINTLRSEVFDRAVRAGFSEEELALRARFINNITGRGNLIEGMRGNVQLGLDVLMTSPRYESSRWETLMEPVRNAVLIRGGSRTGQATGKYGLNRAAVANIQDMAITAGEIAGLMGLASFAGYKVTTDPRSADFLKMRKFVTDENGDQQPTDEVWDAGAGLPTRLRDVLRLYYAFRGTKDTPSGRDTIGDIATRTFNPGWTVPAKYGSIGLQLLDGKEIGGTGDKAVRDWLKDFKIDDKELSATNALPLVVQSFIDAWQDDDKAGAFSAAGREFVGQGVSRYPFKEVGGENKKPKKPQPPVLTPEESYRQLQEMLNTPPTKTGGN